MQNTTTCWRIAVVAGVLLMLGVGQLALDVGEPVGVWGSIMGAAIAGVVALVMWRRSLQ